MNWKEHTTPGNLERYSFWWSEARLLIASLALFIGGYPPVLKITPSGLIGLIQPFLTLSWIISGAASGYLLYRWNAGSRTLFGANRKEDRVAFFVMIVTGFNLGITGLLGTNIGMSLSGAVSVLRYPLFILAGIIYLVAAAYLYKRWIGSGKKIFTTPIAAKASTDTLPGAST